jgi:two-component system phosphate regulon sensor histidine kinase PhoR
VYVSFWIALALIGAAGLWFAWRYFRLARAISEFQSAGLSEPGKVRASAGELAGLARALRLIVDDSAHQVSQLESERDRLAAVLNQLTDGVLIANAAGEVQYANPASVQLFGIADPLGRTVTEVLRNHNLVEAWELSRHAGNVNSAVVELPARHQFLQLIAMPDRHGGGSLLLVQDLTRLRRLETVRQDFVSNISHELRTPLASLKALAETLEGGALQDPEAAPRFLKRMVTEVDSLAHMAQELLELSAIESGKEELQLEAEDPRELLELAADRMRMQADRAGLSLHVRSDDVLPRVQVDPRRLQQVLVNLIHNAIKFTPPGGEIALRAEAIQDSGAAEGSAFVRFSVRDTGQGIPAEDLPRIFERFYRTDRARRKGGTGLGLSIARHIVEAHGGKIWAESVEGRGSVFHIDLPRST